MGALTVLTNYLPLQLEPVPYVLGFKCVSRPILEATKIHHLGGVEEGKRHLEVYFVFL